MMRIRTSSRTLRRLIATTASAGMLGQGVLGAALSLPVLMIATSAHAAAACSGAGAQVVAIYQSGAAVSNPFITSPYFSCSGAPASATMTLCAIYGATPTSSAGLSSDNYFQARSSTGALMKFDLQYSFSWAPGGSGNQTGYYNIAQRTQTNGAGQPVITFPGSDANGNVSSRAAGGYNTDSAGPRLVLPQQSIATGDYTSTISFSVQLRAFNDFQPWNVCNGAVYATFTISYPVLIHVNGTCDIASIAPLDFGRIVASNGTLTSKTVPFYVTSVCSANQNYTLTISDGTNASGTGNYRRRIANGSSYINYGLFTDSGASNVFPVSGVSRTGTGAATDMNTPYYASLQSGQASASLASGIYTDTLIAMVAW